MLSIFMKKNNIETNTNALATFIKSLESKNIRDKYTFKKFNKGNEATDVDIDLIDFTRLSNYGIQRSIQTTKVVSPEIAAFAITFNRMLKNAVKELAELDNIDHLRSHDLRRNFIAESMNELDNIELVREVVQHSDIKTTKKYLEGSKKIFKKTIIKKSSESRPGRGKANISV